MCKCKWIWLNKWDYPPRTSARYWTEFTLIKRTSDWISDICTEVRLLKTYILIPNFYVFKSNIGSELLKVRWGWQWATILPVSFSILPIAQSLHSYLLFFLVFKIFLCLMNMILYDNLSVLRHYMLTLGPITHMPLCRDLPSLVL